MARTLSLALETKQQATQLKPAIRILINGVNYSSRLLFVEHHEEAYRDWATIILNNHDRGLDSVATATSNLLGYRFRIAYGCYTGETVAEPNGDGAGNEYVETADLWVKTQEMISAEGQLICQLYCEGQWIYLREQLLMALANSIDTIDPAQAGTDPYFFQAVFDRTHTVYSLIEGVIEGAMGWTLNPAPSPDDGILTTFTPLFSLEKWPSGSDALRSLIAMTKCYLRPKANLIWDVVFPQSTDAANETYHSYQTPYFKGEYSNALKLVVPNRIAVFANNPTDAAEWTNLIVGDTGAPTTNYVEVLEPVPASQILTQTDANNRASAILTRYQAEELSGHVIVAHDSRVEIYDKIVIRDARDI